MRSASHQAGLQQFLDDDSSYAAWVNSHPAGLVVNCHKRPVANYVKLHRAQCPHIVGYLQKRPTTSDYQKLCSLDRHTLEGWAMQTVGTPLDECPVCRPDRASRSATPVAAPALPNPRSAARHEPVSPAVAASTPMPHSGTRAVPATIDTGCPELDLVWAKNIKKVFNNSHIPIPDADDDLNWHAFLGHSIDMQGFRAAEFAGVDPLTRRSPGFISLKERGIGIRELAALWDVPEIRSELTKRRPDGYRFEETLQVLRTHRGAIGCSLSEAFAHFPWRKFQWSVGALVENSAALAPFHYSFREWLMRHCEASGCHEFPPRDFRQPIQASGKSLERQLRAKLEDSFYKVGPAMSAYMLCDWQLWLWLHGRANVFATYKQDRFHEEFVAKFGRGVISPSEGGFAEWWLGMYPTLPPRSANECIWLGVENGHVSIK